MTQIKEIVPKHGYYIRVETLLSWLAQMRTFEHLRRHRNAPHMRRAELYLLRAAWEISETSFGEGGERA